jgi:hypothetical protein
VQRTPGRGYEKRGFEALEHEPFINAVTGIRNA